MIAFEVNDMTCGRCVSAIAQAVRRVDDAAEVSVDLGTRRVEIRTSAADVAGRRRPSRKRLFAHDRSGCILCCSYWAGWLLLQPLSRMA